MSQKFGMSSGGMAMNAANSCGAGMVSGALGTPIDSTAPNGGACANNNEEHGGGSGALPDITSASAI